MNKIVRDHYPVDKLPEDLREGFPAHAMVRIVLEAVESSAARLPSSLIDDKPMSATEAMQFIQRFKATHHSDESPEDAVARIRKLRDEWEDE